jgi:hypothetical protein
MGKGMGLVSCSMGIIESLKAIGNAILKMAKGIRSSKMDVFTKDTMWMESQKELGNINGLMENTMKVNGLVGWGMVLGCGKGRREIVMLDSGNSEKLMDMEFIFGSMGIVTKANFLNA